MRSAVSSGSVSVVLANWNGGRYIGRCLDALMAQTRAVHEIVVVDNGSVDGSAEVIAKKYPDVTLLRRPLNEGTGRAWNLAIERSSGDYVLILNTDVFLDRDFLRAACRAMGQADDVGLVAARINKAGTDRVENAGFQLQRRLRVTSSKAGEPGFVFGGSGSALLCRRQMMDDIRIGADYFDESFFAYWEDIDLAWRAQLRGWRCAYEPSAIGHHVGSASQEGKVRVVEKSAFFQRHLWKNRYLTFAKNASPGVVLALLPWLALAELLSWPYLLFRIPHRLPAFVGAHADFVRLLPCRISWGWTHRKYGGI